MVYCNLSGFASCFVLPLKILVAEAVPSAFTVLSRILPGVEVVLCMF